MLQHLIGVLEQYRDLIKSWKYYAEYKDEYKDVKKQLCDLKRMWDSLFVYDFISCEQWNEGIALIFDVQYLLNAKCSVMEEV